MKKLSALLLSCFLIAGIVTTTAQAQSIGIKGGINIADFVNADYDTDRRVGGIIGLSFDFTPEDVPFGVESGIYYTRRGIDSPEFNASSLRMDYLEVPLMAKVYFSTDVPVRPHLLGGAYAAYNLDSELELQDDSTVDISDEIRDLDFGILFGVGTDFNVEGIGLSLQARYTMGLTSVFDAEIADFEDLEEEERHGVFSVVLGFKF